MIARFYWTGHSHNRSSECNGWMRHTSLLQTDTKRTQITWFCKQVETASASRRWCKITKIHTFYNSREIVVTPEATSSMQYQIDPLLDSSFPVPLHSFVGSAGWSEWSCWVTSTLFSVRRHSVVSDSSSIVDQVSPTSVQLILKWSFFIDTNRLPPLYWFLENFENDVSGPELQYLTHSQWKHQSFDGNLPRADTSQISHYVYLRPGSFDRTDDTDWSLTEREYLLSFGCVCV